MFGLTQIVSILNRSRRSLLAGIVSIIASLTALPATAAEFTLPTGSKPSTLAPHVAGRVLVKMSASRSKAAAAGGMQLPGVASMRSLRSSESIAKSAGRAEWFVADLAFNNSVSNALSELKRHPDVAEVEPDYIRTISQTDDASVQSMPNDPMISQQYALQRMQMDQAWNINKGSRSVVVAVIDTGVQLDHPELANRIWRNPRETLNGIDDDGNGKVDDVNGWNFVSDTNNPGDDHSHGTHCSGIIAATQNNGVGIAGVADVTIMALKVLSAEGSGSDSDIAAAIHYAADKGAKVISMSLGGDYPSNVGADAVAYAQSKDCVVVAAAGNDSRNSLSYPAGYAGVVSVAATDSADQLADFSNTGEGLAISGPGVRILSTVPGSNYQSMSGTSMACPAVAGVAALIRSANASMNAQQTIERLLGSADDLGTPGYDTTFGWGRVNAFRALSGQGTPAPTPTPAPSPNPTPGQDDQFEENDQPSQAKPIQPGQYSLVGRDDDFFTIDVSAATEVTVNLQGPSGDLDIGLFDADGNLLDSSVEIGSNETMTVPVTAGRYWLLVTPYEGQGSTYTLTITLPGQIAPRPNPTPTPNPNPNPNPGNDIPLPPIQIICGNGVPMPMAAMLAGLVGLGTIRRGRITRKG